MYKKLLILPFLFLLSFKSDDFVQLGKASYYADKFNGRKTASGEVFSQDSLTAAHKTLKFGTKLKVTNLANDSIVIVRVNDRLGSRSPHIIDLSKKGAKQLNFISKGITSVKIESYKGD